MFLRPSALVLTLLILSSLGCGLGVSVEETSADGRFVAAVVNAPTLDPPRQSLWLSEVGESKRKLVDLAEDQESCSRVLWGQASWNPNTDPIAIVAFAIDPPRALVVEAESRRILLDQRLTDDDPWTTDSWLGSLTLAEAGSVSGSGSSSGSGSGSGSESGSGLGSGSARAGPILRYQICRRHEPNCPSADEPWFEVSIPS